MGSEMCIRDRNRLILFNIIPLGGNHITKDISQVLDLSEEDSESIKKSLNQTESIFSDDSKEEFISPVKKRFSALDKNSDEVLDRRELMDSSRKKKDDKRKYKDNMWKGKPPSKHRERKKL